MTSNDITDTSLFAARFARRCSSLLSLSRREYRSNLINNSCFATRFARRRRVGSAWASPASRTSSSAASAIISSRLLATWDLASST